jgi:hypothetical protein
MTAPERLYHYTSISGFLGILKERGIWITDIRCLSDSSELKLLLTALESISLSARYVHFVQWIKRSLAEPGHFVGVACFSERHDDISQWRGYTPFGQGLEICFDGPALQRFAQQEGYELIQCDYDTLALEREAQKIIAEADAKFTAEAAQGGTTFFPEADTRKLLLKAATFKDKAFEGEHEWRLVSPIYGQLGGRNNPNGGSLHVRLQDLLEPQPRFRVGKSTVIPYLKFPYNLPDGRLREWDDDFPHFIRGVTIGPAREPELAKWAVEQALQANHLNWQTDSMDSTVTNSVIPYRTP